MVEFSRKELVKEFHKSFKDIIACQSALLKNKESDIISLDEMKLREKWIWEFEHIYEGKMNQSVKRLIEIMN